MVSISPIAQRRLRAYLFPVLAFGLTLTLYAATAAPWLTWAHHGADGGDLIAAAMTWGVPHPSGYPTYCLLGRAYALLPLGPIARRFNLFSATMGAGTVALVYLSAARVLQRGEGRLTWPNAVIALLAALAFGTGPTLWSQATIAEVYTLHAFFFALCLHPALRTEPKSQWRHGFTIGLALGLGLGAHLTLLLILPGLMVLLWPRGRGARMFGLALGAVIGVSVYAYLPLAAGGDPPINWGDPRTWDGFWWVVSGRLYHPYLFAVPLGHLLSRLGAWAHLWAQEFTWPGLALAFWGLWSWVRKGWRTWAAATAVVFAGCAFYAIGYDTVDSYVYLLPTYLITALWIAEGARTLLEDVSAQQDRLSSIWAPLGLVALSAIPLASVLRHYEALDLSRDRTAETWADQALHELPEGVLVITGDDRHTFTLEYVRWVEGQRQDLTVVDGELLQHPWYARQVLGRCPWLPEPEETLSLDRLVSACLGKRRVYLASRRKDVETSYQTTRRGVLWEVTGRR